MIFLLTPTAEKQLEELVHFYGSAGGPELEDRFLETMSRIRTNRGLPEAGAPR